MSMWRFPSKRQEEYIQAVKLLDLLDENLAVLCVKYDLGEEKGLSIIKNDMFTLRNIIGTWGKYEWEDAYKAYLKRINS